jgi:hypothetical protein
VLLEFTVGKSRQIGFEGDAFRRLIDRKCRPNVGVKRIRYIKAGAGGIA